MRDYIYAVICSIITILIGVSILSLVYDSGQTMNIIHAILYLSGVITFWSYLMYKRINKRN
ncbi:hypothetical protein J2Z44_003071 [Clostridium punense]|uniref:Uncharacterized protein n=1 Tax=Clostridium punense TaxID=1054297 RepID=A0ABS4K627_9CLOT|nr:MULTISPECIES: hypothetical protein [Clostridium]EQB85975.1 hypothetical protein M918_16760 [Clostridium sp. BL8]MBP2023234.1 hypothetical protein [Clostridium punense]